MNFLPLEHPDSSLVSFKHTSLLTMPFLLLAGEGWRAQLASTACAQAHLLLLLFPFQMCWGCAWGIPWREALSQGGKWGSPGQPTLRGCSWPAAAHAPHAGPGALPRHKTGLGNSVSSFNEVKRCRWKMAPDCPGPIAQSRSLMH